MQKLISSAGNDKVKFLKKLYRKATRKNEGKLILEGYRIISEAIRSKVRLHSIFMSKRFADSKEGKEMLAQLDNSDQVFLLEEKLLRVIADTQNPQGVIAIANQRICDRLIADKASTILVLDQLQDPGNMGTMIRTALAAGVEGIIALQGCVDIYNLKVLRATMGAIFNIPIMTGISLTHFKEILKEKRGDFKVISIDLAGESFYYQADYGRQTIVIIGNEAHGIREEILQLSDLRVKIPLIGPIDSLNAAIAAGVILYKIAENRLTGSY